MAPPFKFCLVANVRGERLSRESGAARNQLAGEDTVSLYCLLGGRMPPVYRRVCAGFCGLWPASFFAGKEQCVACSRRLPIQRQCAASLLVVFASGSFDHAERGVDLLCVPGVRCSRLGHLGTF